MMNEFRIGLALRLGVFASAFICVVGIFLILLSHHSHWISHANASRVVKFGILFLIYMQLVRVFLTGWLFVQRREKFFLICSVFIFLVLCYSLFWQA